MVAGYRQNSSNEAGHLGADGRSARSFLMGDEVNRSVETLQDLPPTWKGVPRCPRYQSEVWVAYSVSSGVVAFREAALM